VYRDLREYLQLLEEIGELKHVRGAHWDTEIGVLANLVAARRGPALLFDEIVGYPKGYRVLTNSINNSRTMGVCLGFGPVQSDRELVLKIVENLPRWRRNLIPPKEVKSGPIFENVRIGDEVNLYEFPAPVWHEKDELNGNRVRMLGTGCAVITMDPETGWVNLGAYRNQIFDKNILGVEFRTGRHGAIHRDKYWSKNQPIPVAISLGHDPLFLIFSGMEIAPPGISDYEMIGAIKGEPVEVVKAPITGLPVPANSEIVVEGFQYPDTKRVQEGPFGEWAGVYSHGERGTFKVEAIYYRDDPIILGMPPGKPPACNEMYLLITWRSALIHEALINAGVPNVKGVWCHESGNSRLITIVSIKQSYIGHSRQAGLMTSQCGPGAYANKYVIVVDDDIDPTNMYDVLWAVATRSDPATSIDIIRRTYSSKSDPLHEAIHEYEKHLFGKDPVIGGTDKAGRWVNCPGSVAIIDACIPFELKEFFPESCEPSLETKKKVMEKWPELFS
jgi:4-hydroxy-3-polyprenylbenzoate decarboxylase